MSSLRSTFASVLIVAGLFPFDAGAESPPGSAGQGRPFDPSSVRTVEGEIVEIHRIPKGQSYEGVHLALVASEKRIDVHLGPSWYVDPRLPKLAKGDRVEVKGSEVVLDGKPALIAQTIRRGDARVTLRDDAGIPVWSRARAR